MLGERHHSGNTFFNFFLSLLGSLDPIHNSTNIEAYFNSVKLLLISKALKF